MIRLLTRFLAPTKPYPEREEVDSDLRCPPHDFEGGWGLPVGEDVHAETVPVLFCKACGDMRLFQLREP